MKIRECVLNTPVFPTTSYISDKMQNYFLIMEGRINCALHIIQKMQGSVKHNQSNFRTNNFLQHHFAYTW